MLAVLFYIIYRMDQEMKKTRKKEHGSVSRTKIRKPVRGGVAKVPFIMQMEALECGAASLAMILA